MAIKCNIHTPVSIADAKTLIEDVYDAFPNGVKQTQVLPLEGGLVSVVIVYDNESEGN